jgi:anti-anti-sigma factor
VDHADIDQRCERLSYGHLAVDSRYRIRVERRGEHLAIVLNGSLLTPAPETFVSRTVDLLSALEGRALVIDLGDCAYLSSSAISHLIRYADAAQRGGSKVVMIGAQPKVKVVLDLLGLASVCPILDTEASARAWFLGQGIAV